jgi:hypothetical protein
VSFAHLRLAPRLRSQTPATFHMLPRSFAGPPPARHDPIDHDDASPS